MTQQHHQNHATWECKYHVVFIPKGRKKAICGQIRIIRDYAHVIAMAGASLDNDEGCAIDTLAFDIVERCREAIDDLSDLQGLLEDHRGEVEDGEPTEDGER